MAVISTVRPDRLRPARRGRVVADRCVSDTAEGPAARGVSRRHDRRGLRRGEAGPRVLCATTAQQAMGRRCSSTTPSTRHATWTRSARRVGDARMNYLGFSYGTELGWVYVAPVPGRGAIGRARRRGRPGHDRHRRRPPSQLQGFEAAFDQFAAWCRKTVSPCTTLGEPAADRPAE